MRKKILITGASGFVGQHLIRKIVERKEFFVIGTARKHNFKIERENLEFEKIDLSDNVLVEKLFFKWKPEIVFHLAAYLPKGEKDNYELFLKNNIIATQNLFISALKYGTKHIIYSSTFSVYGKPLYLPVDENHPLNPMNIYAVSKLVGELLGKFINLSKGIKVTILRYSGIFGEGQKMGAIPLFIKKALNNEPITLHSKGKPTNDYVWVEDVVQANLNALYYKNEKGIEIFNIGSGIEINIKELAEKIIHLTNSKSKIILSDEPSPRNFRFVYSIEKAKRKLNYNPHNPWEIIKKSIELYKLK